MNRYKLSLIHFIIALLAFVFGTNVHGQEKPEMIPYRLIPADYHPDSLLEIEIEIKFPGGAPPRCPSGNRRKRACGGPSESPSWF